MSTVENIKLITAMSIRPACALLGEWFGSKEAIAMLVAIGLQESRFTHRAQIGGPARGYWQFEKGGGVRGVMRHPATAQYARELCEVLHYEVTEEAVYVALAHNDLLAAGFARLLLWSDAKPLPRIDDDPEVAWDYYVRNWRPGKPHRETWDEFWKQAQEIVQ